MIEELKNVEAMNKIGGKFRLTALIQKRMLELMEGARPLIEDTEGLTTIARATAILCCWGPVLTFH